MADGAIPAFLKPVPAVKPPPAFLKPLAPVDEPPSFLQPTAPPVEPATPPEEPAPWLSIADPFSALYGVGKTAVELGKGLGAGAVRGTAGILSGAAKLDPLEAYAENIEPFRAEMARVPSMSEDELASLRSRVGEMGTLGSEQFLQTLISDLRDGSVLPEELDTQFGPGPTPIQERRPYQAGTSLIEFADKNLAPDPNTPGIVRLGAEAVGSTLPYLLSNLLVPGGAVLTGMVGGSGENVRRAVEAGATPDQISETSAGGILGGSTEALPLELLGKSVLNFLPPWARLPGQMILQAGAEATQEAGQGVISNVTQSYDPDRPVLEGTGEGALGGGIAGAFMELITRMLAGRHAAGPGPAPVAETQPALPAITPDQIPPVPPAPVPPGPPTVATQVLPTGTETTPTVQPNVPGPGPSEVVPALPVTEQIPPRWTPEQIEERVAAFMAGAGLPPGPEYDKAAQALRDQFIQVNQQDQQIRAAAAVSAATQPPAAIPPAGTLTGGTQVLPTNVPPAPPALAPTEPPGEAAVPAPEVAPPVAEPPVVPPLPVDEGGGPTPPAEQPGSTASVPPAPPAAEPPKAAPVTEPEEDIPVPEEILGPKPQGAQDLRSFIRSQGGIQPTGDLRTAAERYPNIVNQEGKTPEHMRELMAEAGYFGDADAMASTTPADATDMIRDALGGRDIYPSRAADQADQEALDQWNEKVGQLEDIGSEVNEAIKESGRTDITNKEIRQMIGRAFTTDGDAAAAVDFVLARRPEPAPEADTTEPAKTVETEEPKALVGEDQLFIPGTERKEAAGQRAATGDALGKALARDKAAVAENTNARYSIGPAPGEGGVHLTITRPGQKPEVGWHPNEEHAITGAKLDMADRTKRLVKAKKQAGVGETPLFAGQQTDIEQAPPAKPAPVAKAPEPAPEPAKPKVEPTVPPTSQVGKRTPVKKAEPAPAPEPVVEPTAAKAEEPEVIPYPPQGWRGKNAKSRAALLESRGIAPERAAELGAMKWDNLPRDIQKLLTTARRPAAEPAPKPPRPKTPTRDLRRIGYAIEDAFAGEEEGPLEERAEGPALPDNEVEVPELWGDDPDVDAEITSNDEADVAINTLEDRTRRAGETPTFKDVSMVDTTPMNPASAYLDAGLSPDDAMIMSPEGRFQALATLFRQKFGFKTVSRVGTYGKANALDAIDALMDGYRGVRAMMHILGLPTTGASLGGRLSLTIGRKTPRSAFLGSYNPEDQGLELVGRSNGFAHEWMHALDHWLMDTVFGPIVGKGPKLASAFTRDRGLDPSVTLEDHFIQVMNAIFFDDAALAARVLDLQIKAAKVHRASHKTKAGQSTQEALDAQRMLDDISAGRSNLGIKQKSEYYKTSKNYGKGQDSYWTNPAELLARAFEAYVAWRVNIVDPTFPNNFMTKGDAAYLNGADARLAETFPHDPDRTRIFGAIEILMGAVMSQTSIGVGTPSVMPSGAELIQDDVFYAHAAEQERQNRAKANQRSQLGRLKNRLMQATSLQGWNELYDAASDSLGRRFGAPEAILSTMQTLGTSFKGMMFTEAAVANHLVERPQSKNAREYLHAIASQLFELAPGRGDFVPETWTEGVIAFTRQYAGKLENILDRHNIPEAVPRNPKTEKAMGDVGQRNRLYEILTTGNVPAGTSQSEVAAAAAIRAQIFDEIYRDARRAGLDIGYLEDAPYLPVIPDPYAIHNDMEGYIEAATELYQLVYDRSVGTVVGNALHADPVRLQDAINDLKKWNGTDSGLGDPDIVKLRAQGSRQLKQIRDLQKGLPGSEDPDLDRDMIDHLQGQLQATMDELSTHVGRLWAETKAHRWHEAFVRGEYSAMDTLGPQTKHTKTRVLPSESQKIMQAFVVNDPIDAASVYINSMARKIEYSSRFGQQAAGNKDLEFLLNRENSPLLTEMKARGLDRTKPRDRITAIMELTNPNKDNRLEMLFLEAQRAGAVTTDLRALRGQVEYMTGRRSENSAIMRELSNAIYVAGSLALMPRSAWTSMTEPITALARTGDFHVAGATLSYYMKEFFAFNGTTVADVHDVTKAIGMIASETQEVMLQSTMGDIPMNSRLSKFMAAFYERIQLAPLTRMQTRTGVIGYHVWLKKLLRTALGTTPRAVKGKRVAAGDAAVARANLRELGINDHQVQPMWDFLAGRGEERIMSRADANTPMGRLWAVGQRRYAHSVVQQGTKATSTRLTAHPMGRLVMGLMRFAYTFTRNILIRPIRQATRDERLRIEAGENRHAAAARSFRDNLLYRMGIGFGALWLGQFLVGLVRSFLFDREQFDKHIDEEGVKGTALWQALIALSRTGVFGAADPLIQAWKGLRYQRDLTSVTSGAFLNVGLNWLQSLGNLSANNSPNTNTTERNFVQDTLRMYQTPLVMAFLNALPGGRAAGFMYGVLGMVASSNSVIAWETNWIAGEKRDTSPKGRAGRLDLRDRPKMR